MSIRQSLVDSLDELCRGLQLLEWKHEPNSYEDEVVYDMDHYHINQPLETDDD